MFNRCRGTLGAGSLKCLLLLWLRLLLLLVQGTHSESRRGLVTLCSLYLCYSEGLQKTAVKEAL